MQLNKQISIIDFEDKKFRIKTKESGIDTEPAFTHYLHNNKNGVSKYYKLDAIQHVKNLIEYKFPEEIISTRVAENTLKYLISQNQTIPFPSPKKPKFKFIDLFAGIGGFRLAFQNLGGKCVFTSEWDKYSQQTYYSNFGEVPFGDITRKRTKDYIPDDFDILCAGFPCQAFSIAGKRGGFEDTRGTLFFDVAEIIKKKQPKAIFLENVKGLRNHDKGKTLSTILNVLREDLGYYVPDPQIINAKDFGVPQNRERIFIVGFNKNTEITNFQYPKPVNEKTSLRNILEEKEVSVKYYLSTTYIDTLRKHKERHQNKGNGFGFQIIPNDGVANAVVCGGMGRERNLIIDHRLTNFKPITNISGEVNREGIRKMTPREWARLQGFPDNYKIVVSDAQAYKQFGNSVAVPAIQKTAQQILKTLNL
ncbi:DNA cytosine methyltransferase [uncultured Tenacibaculum sp.]|uniref:DNA cytosine methyltransferase n=1 Tax=uncultured Tenacibaculum sp. TaxID=174713 RepID=UPI002619B29F|nr:DNA cytosine methyltransferase [uncultured Tenacibaculum sp.]